MAKARGEMARFRQSAEGSAPAVRSLFKDVALGSLAANIMSNVVSLFSVVAFAACASYVSRTAGADLTEQDRAHSGAPVS